MAERSCETCVYGDNGSKSDGCSAECWEPELPDYEPIESPKYHVFTDGTD